MGMREKKAISIIDGEAEEQRKEIEKLMKEVDASPEYYSKIKENVCEINKRAGNIRTAVDSCKKKPKST